MDRLRKTLEILEDIKEKVLEEAKKTKQSIEEKLDVKLDKDHLYEQRWVFYHTILAIELLITNILLLILVFKD